MINEFIECDHCGTSLPDLKKPDNWVEIKLFFAGVNDIYKNDYKVHLCNKCRELEFFAVERIFRLPGPVIPTK